MTSTRKIDRNLDMLADYLDGMRDKQLAKKYKISSVRIRHILRKYGVTVMLGIEVGNHIHQRDVPSRW